MDARELLAAELGGVSRTTLRDHHALTVRTALRAIEQSRIQSEAAMIEKCAKVAETYVSFPQPVSRAAQFHEREAVRHNIATVIRALAPSATQTEGESR